MGQNFTQVAQNNVTGYYVYDGKQCFINGVLLATAGTLDGIHHIGDEIFNYRELTISAWDYKCYMTKFYVSLYPSILIINTILLLIIALISIFGKIKDNYKWFILNQVIWDAITIYEGICNNELLGLFHNIKSDCHIAWQLFSPVGYRYASDTYSSLFCLTISRCLCLYNMPLYEKLTKRYRIFIWIFVVNLFCFLTKFAQYLFEADVLDFSSPRRFQFLQEFRTVSLIKPPVFMVASLIAVLLMIYRIGGHLCFQYKNKLKDFNNMLRITIVIILEFFMYFFIFLLELYQSLYQYMKFTVIYTIDWLEADWSLVDPGNYLTLKLIRVFLESVLVLTIITGYRESIMDCIKMFYYAIKKKISSSNQVIPINPPTNSREGFFSTTVIPSAN